MSLAQPKGKLLFVAQNLDACFCADLLEALKREGVEVVSVHRAAELQSAYYKENVSMIVVFGDGNRMFLERLWELETAENEIPVIYLHTQAPRGIWPEFVTFLPWPCAYLQETAEAVLQMARQLCHILPVPVTHLD